MPARGGWKRPLGPRPASAPVLIHGLHPVRGRRSTGPQRSSRSGRTTSDGVHGFASADAYRRPLADCSHPAAHRRRAAGDSRRAAARRRLRWSAAKPLARTTSVRTTVLVSRGRSSVKRRRLDCRDRRGAFYAAGGPSDLRLGTLPVCACSCVSGTLVPHALSSCRVPPPRARADGERFAKQRDGPSLFTRHPWRPAT